MIEVLTVLSRLSTAGGIPNVVRTLLRRTDPDLVRHHVFQVRPLLDDVQERKMPSLQSLRALNVEGNWTRSPRSILASLELLGAIRDLEPDVVHLHTGSALMALPAKARLGGRTTWLFDFHEPLELRHSKLTSRAVMTMARRSAWGVCHSPQVLDQIAASGAIPHERLSLIPLGIDTAMFRTPATSRQEWRSRFGLLPDDRVVVSVGILAESKGLDKLLETARLICSSHAQVVFLLVGRTSRAHELEEKIEQLGLSGNVRLLGYVEDLPSALNAADVFLTTSDYEGFGLAVVEAMAAGLPTVASAVGGLNFVVEDAATGHLAKKNDIEGYVSHLGRLLTDLARSRAMGARGQARAIAQFDESAMVGRYVDLYQRIAAAR